ncbi:MAG: hypothetical protein ACE5EK_07220 [Nitrospinales bacterium]
MERKIVAIILMGWLFLTGFVVQEAFAHTDHARHLSSPFDGKGKELHPHCPLHLSHPPLDCPHMFSNTNTGTVNIGSECGGNPAGKASVTTAFHEMPLMFNVAQYLDLSLKSRPHDFSLPLYLVSIVSTLEHPPKFL